MDTINHNTLVVATVATTVALILRSTGEVLGEIPVEPGIVPVTDFLPFQNEHVGLEFGDGMWLTDKAHRIITVFSDGHYNTACEGTYTPSAASTQARLFDQQMQAQAAAHARLMSEIRATTAAQAVMEAPVVVEQRPEVKKPQEAALAAQEAKQDDAKP